jgi:hypothetical protein
MRKGLTRGMGSCSYGSWEAICKLEMLGDAGMGQCGSVQGWKPENLGVPWSKSWSTKLREPGVLMCKGRRRKVYPSFRTDSDQFAFSLVLLYVGPCWLDGGHPHWDRSFLVHGNSQAIITGNTFKDTPKICFIGDLGIPSSSQTNI